MIKSIYIFVLMVPFITLGQVVVEEDIMLTGNNQERQVKNLKDPSQKDQAVNAQTVQYNKLTFAEVTGGNANNIQLELPISPDAYTEGLHIYFLAPTENTDSVTINLNNLGNIGLTKNNGEKLDSSELVTGLLVSAIYIDGTFNVLSDLYIPCPNGFVEVADDYCIQINENAPATFWEAVDTCGNMEGKLCDWADWYYACQDSNLVTILQDMTGNWEWIDAGGNNSTQAVPLTSNTAHVVGETDCKSRWTGVIQTSSGLINRSYRCCYKKRP